MYIALVVTRKLTTEEGVDVSTVNREQGIAGMTLVFETKDAARKIFGPNVEVLEIQMGDPAPEAGGERRVRK